MVMNTRKIPRLDEIYLDQNIISERIRDKKAPRYNSTYSSRRKKESRHKPTTIHNNSRDHSHDKNVNDLSEEEDHLRNKSEIHKLAERVCGDWSEHVSRNGKRYFYNSRTEKSQWDRPKNWIDDVPISSSSRTPERNKNSSKKEKLYNAEKCRKSEFSDDRHRNKESKRKTDPPIDKQFREYIDKKPTTTDDRFNSSRMTKKNNFIEYSASRNNGVVSHSSNIDRYRKNSHHRSGKKSPDRLNISERKQDTASRRHREKRLDRNGTASRDDSSSQSPERSSSSIRIVSGDEGGTNAAVAPEVVKNEIKVVGDKQINGHVNDVVTPVVDNNLYEDMDISPTVSPVRDPRKKASIQAVDSQQQPKVSPLDGNNFLSSLQQFVLQPSCAGEVEVGNEKISTAQLAFLPILLTQLSVIQQKGCQAQNQHIIQQAIPLLMRLQEMLVVQQQQRQLQQRQLQQLQLQQLLLQLLKMQKNSKPSNQELDAESPYSPPDSDDTHSSSNIPKPAAIVTPTSNSATTTSPAILDLEQTSACGVTPRHQNSHHQSTSSCTTTPISTHPSPDLATSSTHPSPNLIPAPLFRNSTTPDAATPAAEGFQLSASFAKYFDRELIAHVPHSPADEIDSQAERMHWEAHALSSVYISQLLIGLKRDRSLIRTQEILSTLTEQRVISVRQELFDVERLQPLPSAAYSDPIEF